MRLVACRDIREPDLARIESPFFACSKIRRLRLDGSHCEQIYGAPQSAQHALIFDHPPLFEKLLHDVEEGRWFLLIDSGPVPFQPAVRWQPGTDRWVVDESLGLHARFNLEQAIARIEHEKHRRSRAPATSKIIPINGNPTAGILKRYANTATGGFAFPDHLTAFDEKSLGSKVRKLYGGNNIVQNQADIAAYNDKPSMLGITHGQIFDAAENAATALSLLEGGLLLSRLKGTGRITDAAASRQTTPGKINGGSVKAESRGYLSEIETSKIPNQQSAYTCGPACGVAELKKRGIDISEAELAHLAGTRNKYGTDPTRLAEALNKKLPAGSTTKYRGGYLDNYINNPEKVFDELTANGQWIMQTNPDGYHYVIVDSIDDAIVTVLDPWRLQKPAAGNGLEATITKRKLLEQWAKGDFGFIYPADAK